WHMNVGDDITAHNTAISDFMEVLSGHVVTEALDASLQSLSMASNFEGIDAIISNISTVQMDALSLTTEDMLADAGVRIMTDGNDYAYSTGESASIHGLGGNDTILGNTGDDHIFGGDGDDVLYDFRGGNNTLYGGEGNDVLYTGNGNDILYGSDGDDLIIGLGGADTFILREGDTGIDTIYYADAREGDRLDISDFLDQFDPLQDAIDDFVILSDDGFSTTVSVDVDGQGAGEAVQIATLYGSTGVEVEGIIDLSSITTV
ncbi:MAG: type I secretion C-terminal target domain-containing protein, partial [Alphaproteobacteria bacterium]|nr:type I secretion C-terminal target domain-containing protein [Alphaproteobacteria bacterium]